jgi:hypothetical protein
MAGTLVIGLLFLRMGRPELTLPVGMSVGAFGFLLVVKWRLRCYVWFWATIAVFAALRVAILCLLPWTKKWVPAAACAGAASIDIYAMLVIISVVGHLSGSEV